MKLPDWMIAENLKLDREESPFVGRLRELREHQVEMARYLWFRQKHRVYRQEGCSSIVEWASRIGISPREGWLLVHVGECMELVDGLEEMILKGDIPLESAEQLRRVKRVQQERDESLPGLRDVDWLGLAVVCSVSDFRHAYKLDSRSSSISTSGGQGPPPAAWSCSCLPRAARRSGEPRSSFAAI